MTKGKALIEARTLLGPDAQIQERGRDLCVLDGRGIAVSYGRTWDEAIRNLRLGKRAV